MGKMSAQFRECLKTRKIVKIEVDKEMIKKEIEQAEYDLEKATNSLKAGDFKWATIQVYYSMFHSARALIFSKAYREKSHRCLLIALEELFVRQNLLERETLETFREAMDLREEADYGATYSEEGATATMKNARKFLEKTKQILKDLPN